MAKETPHQFVERVWKRKCSPAEVKTLLWHCTAFPMAERETIEKQLINLREKSGGDVDSAIAIADFVDGKVYDYVEWLRAEWTRLESAYSKLVRQVKQLKGEKPIPFAWWKDCPALAQRTMERVIEENEQLRAKLEGKDEEKENEA